MAKSRAQRKAEQRKRQALEQSGGEEAKAQHDTQVPESADVVEAELAEQGANLDELKGDPREAPAPSRAETAPSRSEPAPEPAEPQQSRRDLRRLEKERREAAKASIERRKPREAPVERERGRVVGFFISCVAELRRVQWPTRDTLIQASAVTVVFIIVAAAYLGVLDAAFNWAVNRVI